MTDRYDILVAGEINPDLILTGDVTPVFDQVEKLLDSAALVIGSSSAIFACGAARLGLRVGFVGICGDDLFGRFMLEELSHRGVDTAPVQVDPSQSTGLSVILSRGTDRAILTYPGAIAALRAEAVTDDLLHRARHLHVASYFLQTALQPGLPNLFHRARALGLTTSLDPNWDPTGEWRGFERLLPLVDVFLPNENEARALAHRASVEQALESLSQVCGTVAVKCGSHGAQARQGQLPASAAALPGTVIDTVGAGDSFDAGFLYGWLNGWRLERTLGLAAICGSLSTRAAGGTTGQAALEEALAYLQQRE
jgi:sugar/nucleoside kinase (ribokinase family)